MFVPGKKNSVSSLTYQGLGGLNPQPHLLYI